MASMSPIRSLLVHVDNTPESAVRLEFARSLAIANEAALSAMFVAQPPQRPLSSAFGESPLPMNTLLEQVDDGPARSMFEERSALGGPAMRWIAHEGADLAAFCRQGLYADMLVLGQPSQGRSQVGAAPAGFVESALVQTGKPGLVLPSTGEIRPFKDVLIGWNATTPAARAIGAALPFLVKARRVHVLEAAGTATGPQGIGLREYLGFHGVVPVVHSTDAPAAEAGDRLLSVASDVGADLLVMGCYGRSRAMEWVWGGATRTVMKTMTLPVLMAH